MGIRTTITERHDVEISQGGFDWNVVSTVLPFMWPAVEYIKAGNYESALSSLKNEFVKSTGVTDAEFRIVRHSKAVIERVFD